MKLSFGLISLFFVYSVNAQASTDSCPNLQGDYVMTSCPVAQRPYQVTRVIQPDCRVIGFQQIQMAPDGSVLIFSPPHWDSVGAGKLLDREDKTTAYLKERFYDQDSLYSYNYQIDKATGTTKFVRAEVIDLLRDGNLFVAYDSLGGGATWMNVKNCAAR